MSYLERYRNGEHLDVWSELQRSGDAIQEPEILADALEVVRETMQRVRRNLELLIERLRSSGYQFGIYADGTHIPSFSTPLREAPPDAASHIARLEAQLGHLPLSLYGCYAWLGRVDLSGHHPDWDRFEYLDPLVLYTCLDRELLSYLTGYRSEPPEIEIAPDYYHKENVSGGPAYTIEAPGYKMDAPVKNLPGFLIPSGMRNPDGHPYLLEYIRASLSLGGFTFFGAMDLAVVPQDYIAFLRANFIPF